MAAFEVKGPGLDFDRTELLAVGAGVLFSEGLCLLLEERLHGALDQSAADLQGEFFHDGKADVQAWPLGSEGAAGDDFSPRGRQLTEFADVFRS